MLRERKDDPSPPGLRQVQVGHHPHPHPLVLVRLLRAHVKRFSTTLDGRIFQTARGGLNSGVPATEVARRAGVAGLAALANDTFIRRR